VSALSSLVTPRRTDWFGDAPRDCGSVRAHLHEYVDEELDLHVPAERAILLAVANHVTHCTPCARVETQLRAMHLAVAAVGARMHVIGPTKRMSLPGELTLLQSVTAHALATRAQSPLRSGNECLTATPPPMELRQQQPLPSRPR